MIPFLRRKKEEPIYLDCYTASRYAYNQAKVDYARKYVPEWWKSHPTLVEGNGTIKHCVAFTNYYAKGIVIPLWGEVEIDVFPLGHEDDAGNLYHWRSSNKDFDLHTGNHPKRQWGGFGGDNLLNIKIMSPWAFKTRDLVHFAWSQPTWSQPETFNTFTALPGVVEFKTQTSTHINYVVEMKSEAQTFKIPPLTPVVMLHPLTERSVELRHHLVDFDTMNQITHRAGGMVLGTSDEDVLRNPKGFRAKKAAFWGKADELNKCPFE